MKSTVAGQEPESRHDESGKSANWRISPRAARYSGRGTCIRAGHSDGLAMGQLLTWSRVEYWGPQTFWHVSVPLTGTHMQPHLYLGLSSSLLITVCKIIRMTHIRIGYATMHVFVLMFLFCSSSILVYECIFFMIK